MNVQVQVCLLCEGRGEVAVANGSEDYDWVVCPECQLDVDGGVYYG